MRRSRYEKPRIIFGKWKNNQTIKQRVTLSEAKGSVGPMRGDGQSSYARYRRSTSVAFCPPRPKLFDSTTFTSCLRASFGT